MSGGGPILVIALVGVGLYACTAHGRKTGPQAHYVRSHMRNGKRVRAHMRGVGKPSLIFLTVLGVLFLVAIVQRAMS